MYVYAFLFTESKSIQQLNMSLAFQEISGRNKMFVGVFS